MSTSRLYILNKQIVGAIPLLSTGKFQSLFKANITDIERPKGFSKPRCDFKVGDDLNAIKLYKSSTNINAMFFHFMSSLKVSNTQQGVAAEAAKRSSSDCW